MTTNVLPSELGQETPQTGEQANMKGRLKQELHKQLLKTEGFELAEDKLSSSAVAAQFFGHAGLPGATDSLAYEGVQRILAVSVTIQLSLPLHLVRLQKGDTSSAICRLPPLTDESNLLGKMVLSAQQAVHPNQPPDTCSSCQRKGRCCVSQRYWFTPAPDNPITARFDMHPICALPYRE